MALKHSLTRWLVSALPSEVGLGKLKRFLPGTPGGGFHVRRLRGHRLRLQFDPSAGYAGWFLYYRGMYEEGVVRTCRRLLRRGMNFVDVGANAGLYSVIGGFAVRPGGRVLSVEPQPALAGLVRSNVLLNRLENVVVETCAIAAQEGTGRLHFPSRNNGAATLRLSPGEPQVVEAVEVAVRTLPGLMQRSGLGRVDAMKIDVEGAEMEVLRGSEPVLRGADPPQFIFIEVIDRLLARFGSSERDLLAFLHDLGYRTAGLHRGRWRSIASVEEHGLHGWTPDLVAVRPGTRAWGQLRGALR